MRILHVCDGLPSAHSPGGGHVFFWQNLAALSELGHEVHLVVCNALGPVEPDVAARVASVTYAVPIAPESLVGEYRQLVQATRARYATNG